MGLDPGTGFPLRRCISFKVLLQSMRCCSSQLKNNRILDLLLIIHCNTHRSFAMPASKTSSIKAMYDERSDGYDNSFHSRLADDYVKWSELKPGDSVLDLACGTGLVTIPAKKLVGRRGRVVGVDVSTGMLEVAKRKAEEEKVDVVFREYDITDLNDLGLLSQSEVGFDVITCAAALVLLDEPLIALKHWMTFMVSGGRLVIDMPVKHGSIPIHIFGRLENELGLALEWDSLWLETGDSLAKLLTDAGLVLDRVFTTPPYQSKTYHVDSAAEVFAGAITSPMFRKFGDSSIKDRAEQLFIDRFRQMADPNGLVHEEARFHVGIAHKP